MLINVRKTDAADVESIQYHACEILDILEEDNLADVVESIQDHACEIRDILNAENDLADVDVVESIQDHACEIRDILKDLS